MPQVKNVKVISKNSYRWWKLSHDIIFFGIPIVYLIIFYELFSKASQTPASTKITVAGWIVIIVLMAFFKSVIFNMIVDVKENFSIISKRITTTMILGIVSIGILLSSLWIKHLVLLLLVFCVSMTLSIFPLYKYTKNKEYYERVKKIQEDEEAKRDINQGLLKVK